MAILKLLVWNTAWMNDLFTEDGDFRVDNAKPQHEPSTTVKKRREDISSVIKEIDPDIVIILEGPNSDKEFKLFFDTDIPGEWQTKVQPTKGSSQLICCAVRTDTGKFDANAPFKFFDANNIPAFQPFELDNEKDTIIEKYTFERLPLYVEINPVDGKKFRILGLHLKSKGIFSAFEWSKFWEVSDANRRKILAQATQIRLNFLDTYLQDPATKNLPLIVCGDINDGPGMDASEKRIFGSGIERLMGTVWFPEWCLGNAIFDTLGLEKQSQLDFSDVFTTTFKDPLFNSTWHKEWIDHILYSHPSHKWVSNAQIHNKAADGTALWTKYKHASDHLPVSVNITM